MSEERRCEGLLKSALFTSFMRKHKSAHVLFALLCSVLLCAADASSLVIQGDRARTVLLHNGLADDSISCSYVPEIGVPSSRYTVVAKSSAPDVLQSEDVDVLPALESINRSVNTTLTVEFERSVGQVEVEIEVLRSDGSVYLSTSVRYTVVGFSFFYADKSGQRTLLQDNTLNILSYAELLEVDFTAVEVLICFPDGSTSTESSSSRRVTQILEDTKVSSTDSAAILQAHSFDSCATQNSEDKSLSKDCGFGFLRKPTLTFGLRFLRFRSGRVTIKFSSDSLLASSEFEETYETFLSIVVGGAPPPAIVSVQPSGGTCRTNGGQIMKIAIVNTKQASSVSMHFAGSEDLQLFGVPEYLETSKTTIASFITAPGLAEKTLYSVNVVTEGISKPAVWAAEGKPFSLNCASVEQGIIIRKMEPSSGPFAGGFLVTLSGTFPGYDASVNSGDAIYVGKNAVEKSSIVSASQTTIVFKMPAKISSSSDEYDVPVRVEIKKTESTAVIFRYNSFYTVHIAVLGSSFDTESGIHRISICGKSSNEDRSGSVILIPEPNNGAHNDEIRYQWILVDFETRKELARSSEEWFKVSKSVLQDGTKYEVVVLATEESTGTLIESKVHLQADASQFYGLALATSRHRTIAQPLTDVRVTAMLFDDGPCFRSMANRNLSQDIVFEWKYAGKVYKFSQATPTFEEAAIGARRFGREFMIPRRLLRYGTHTVVCTASSGDPQLFAATAAVNITVQPSTLKAQIGSGQSYLQLSAGSSFTMYASESADLDEISLDPDTLPSGLTYKWRCEVSTSGGSSFYTFEACSSDIVDAENEGSKQMEISKKAIDSLRIAGSSTFLRFFLVVGKIVPEYGLVSSTEVSQVVEISDNVEQSSHRTSPQSLSYGTGSASLPDLLNWRSDDALIISPREPADVEWRYKLVKPETESFSFLLDSSHLLPYPGYVEASNLVAGRKALGIAGGAMKTDTLYKFRIEFEASTTGGKSGGYEEIDIKVARNPLVSFATLSGNVGTTETIFVVRARSSFVSPHYKVYFFVELPGEGRICVDGCSGNDVAAFRLPRAGAYNISCAISDSRGAGEYIFAQATQSLTVTRVSEFNGDFLRTSVDSPLEDADLESSLNQSLRQGDHASFELNCISIAKTAAQSSDQTTKNVVGALSRQALSRLDGLSTTTEPNTPLAGDYVKIALAFSALPTSSEVFGDPGTFQDACRLVRTAVQNTPASEAYRLDGELIEFLSNMAAHANQHQSGGTHRRRLLQLSDDDSAESLRTNVLDLAEMTTPTVMMALSKDKPCGYETSRVVQQVANVSIAIRCNKEQGSELLGRHSSMYWCPDVFSETADSPRLFVLSEMNDYLASSNVLSLSSSSDSQSADTDASGTNENFTRAAVGSDSAVLVKTFALKMEDNSKAIGTASLRPVDMELSDGSCFGLNQTVKATELTFNSTADYQISCQHVEAIEFENVKELGKELPNDPYKEVRIDNSTKEFSSFEAGIETTSLFTRLRRVNGLTFGARRSGCASSQPLLLGVSAVAGVTVGLLVAVISSTLFLWMGLTYQISQSAATSGASILAGTPYIERDVYGRNTIGGENKKKSAIGVATGAVGDAEEDVVAFKSPHRTGRETFSS